MAEGRKYGLLASDLHNIQAVFQSNARVQEAILFGSRAKGNFSPGSDIDIAVKGNGLNLDDQLLIINQIDKLSLPYMFDIVLYDRIKEPALLDHINQVGIPVYKRS